MDLLHSFREHLLSTYTWSGLCQILRTQKRKWALPTGRAGRQGTCKEMSSARLVSSCGYSSEHTMDAHKRNEPFVCQVGMHAIVYRRDLLQPL